MHKRFFFLIILLISVKFLFAQAKEEEQVRTAFEGYKKTLLKNNGKKAIRYVDTKTIQYYATILGKVKNADSTEVEKLPLLDKFMVLSIRHRAPREDILKFDGKTLLVYAIEQGMVGKNNIAVSTIGDVIISGNSAKGQFVSNRQSTPFYFEFFKEDNKWKLNLTSLLQTSNMAFQKMIYDSEENQNEYLFLLLENVTGHKPGKEIWEPVK